jgi:hypothetical protein
VISRAKDTANQLPPATKETTRMSHVCRRLASFCFVPSLRARALGAVGMAALAAAFLTPAAASAATPAPQWAIQSLAAPTDFSTADNSRSEGVCLPLLGAMTCDAYFATATDVGAAPMKAREIKLEDTLPAGLSVRRVGLFWKGIEAVAGHTEQENLDESGTLCTVALPKVTCTLKASFFSELGHVVQPDDRLIMEVAVTVDEPTVPGPLTNTVRVQGGGEPSHPVPPAEAGAQNTLEQGPPPFGFSLFSSPALDSEGSGSAGTAGLQAGSHPYELPTHIGLTSKVRRNADPTIGAMSVENPRDILVDLPPGLAGSALSTPVRCTFGQLSARGEHTGNGESACPKESQVGFLQTYPLVSDNVVSPLFNMVPERGAVAEFGYGDIENGVHLLKASLVPGPQGYVLRTSSLEAPEIPLTSIVADIYGDPATRDGSILEPAEHVPTLTMPADCNGEPLVTQVHMDSWQHPGSYLPDGEPNLSEPDWVTATSESPPVTGCNQLIFEPTIAATPSTNRADSPTGLEVDLKVPQTEGTETLGTPPLKKAVVTLPEGVSVNPSSANGLGACSLAQIGMSASGQPDAARPTCPDSSKIGTVELFTPAVKGTLEDGALEGEIYVAKQGENPFHSLLAIYIVVNDPKTGVLVKLAGEVNPNPATGQLQTVVDNSPQFPFSELRTHFFAGSRAALKTSAVCGTYTVTSSLTPWSAPESGPPATPASSFQTSQGASGGSCPTSPGAEPNHPAFTAGTLNTQAGAYTPFVVHGARADGDQPITQVNLTLPKGLTGKLAGIPYCPEADIALAKSREHEGGGAEELAHPACPAASEVGVVHVGAGAGPEPFYVTGHAYLTGPYKGAPLGIAIVSPAVAGPFDLGDVVVRAALDVDPLTAQITAVSDPIPTILHGIPLDIRSITLEMARHEFTLNPTNCEKTAITGEAVGQFGTTAALSNPFQVGGCKNLAFRPKLQISLKGSTKHAGHPALKAVLTYPKGGAYANVAGAQVNLPHSEFIDQANLNKTCTKPVLLAGACPASTIYGKVKAWTPLLEKPLEGPVYLVGGFGYQLPALVAELDGQIKVLLVGKVDSGPNHGIRNTFEAVPDAPVEKFILEMKGGPKYSLLENSEDLCSRPQKAIASFTAQNGATLKLTPKIAISCKGKKGSKGKKHKGKKGNGAGGHGKSSKRSADSLDLSRLLGRW